MHGVGRSRGRCRLAVRARRDDAGLVLEVENDLPPADSAEAPASGSGVGLQNTRARLEQLYGSRARLDLEIRPERGALARVVLPYRELEAGPAVP